MAKRYTDTNKFEDVWYMELPSKYKLFYDYILAKCDAVGVWKPNIKMASFTLNEQLNADEFLALCGEERIYVKENGDWFLRKFCDFQYGILNENSTAKPIQSYIAMLKKHNLWIPYTKGINTLKEKDKEKDKDNNTIKAENYFKISGETVYGKPSEFMVKNFQMTIEQVLMALGQGRVIQQKLMDEIDNNYPSGYEFEDNNHMINCIKVQVKKMAVAKPIKNELPIGKRATAFSEAKA